MQYTLSDNLCLLCDKPPCNGFVLVERLFQLSESSRAPDLPHIVSGHLGTFTNFFLESYLVLETNEYLP